MRAFEFEASMENGFIAIPDEYQLELGEHAKLRVILLDALPMQPIQTTTSFHRLKTVLDGIVPGQLFDSIEDPVTWQKELRDEWN